MKEKPRILINRQRATKHFRFRGYWGRYNGYGHTPKEAYRACLICAWRSKYLVGDQKKHPQLRELQFPT